MINCNQRTHHYHGELVGIYCAAVVFVLFSHEALEHCTAAKTNRYVNATNNLAN